MPSISGSMTSAWRGDAPAGVSGSCAFPSSALAALSTASSNGCAGSGAAAGAAMEAAVAATAGAAPAGPAVAGSGPPRAAQPASSAQSISTATGRHRSTERRLAAGRFMRCTSCAGSRLDRGSASRRVAGGVADRCSAPGAGGPTARLRRGARLQPEGKASGRRRQRSGRLSHTVAGHRRQGGRRPPPRRCPAVRRCRCRDSRRPGGNHRRDGRCSGCRRRGGEG